MLQAAANRGKVAATSISNDREELPLQEEEGRPWYMSGGTRWPLPAAKSRKSGRRIAALWPHEDPGSDRITNQLMFVPPSSSAGESNGQRLKKILIYNGLGSWAPLKPGRDVFTQARCPVDTCTITSEKAQAADADAILYKDHFVNPGHPRPPRQVKGLHFLYSQGSTESHDRVVSPELRDSNFATEAGGFVISLRPFWKLHTGGTFKMLRQHTSLFVQFHPSRNCI